MAKIICKITLILKIWLWSLKLLRIGCYQWAWKIYYVAIYFTHVPNKICESAPSALCNINSILYCKQDEIYDNALTPKRSTTLCRMPLIVIYFNSYQYENKLTVLEILIQSHKVQIINY